MNVEFPIQLTPFTYRTPKKSNSAHSGLSDQLLPVQRSPPHTVLLPVASHRHTIGESWWAARFLLLNTVLGLR